MSCPAKDVHGNPCRNKGPFCRFHTYMKEYTPEMIAGCKLCKGCKKMKFMEMETCEECRLHGAEKRKQAKAAIVLCAKEGCKYKKSENKYCGKHQMYKFIDETDELGLKTCFNVIRGCRSQMAMDGKSSCDTCLGKDREEDHKKRSVEPVKTETEKQCSVCRKMHQLEAFKSTVGETKTCTTCREANKRADEKRDVERVRELSRKNAAKPERKEVKKLWRNKNTDKLLSYCLKSRAKNINEDAEKYLKQQAEQAKKWRLDNPEKVQSINHKKINSMDSQYGVYKSSAIAKQLDFEIKIDEYKTIVILPCHYCGIVQEKGFNGLDRMDSTAGYVMGNCVSCCQMCNYMKVNLSANIFVERAEHIATFHKKINGLYCPHAYKDIMSVNYATCKFSANSRKINFDLTKEAFYEKRKECCYLCGKENSETHQNGLDRIDSAIGYIETNLHSCCGSCNYMKNNYSLESFLEKCTLIALNHKPVDESIEMNHIVSQNKLSKSEKKEIHDAKKELKIKQLKERYTEEQIEKRIQASTSKLIC